MPRDIKTLIVVPENNTTMKPEISALCPALVPIPVVRHATAATSRLRRRAAGQAHLPSEIVRK